MTKKPDRNSSGTVPLLALRWTARILSILSLGVVLLFAFGERLHLWNFSPHELTLFVFFPVGVCLGILAAWKWEILGGAITLASLTVFYLLHNLLSGGFPGGFAFIALAVPGFLFLLCGLLTKTKSTPIA